jgi:hypothetical protein
LLLRASHRTGVFLKLCGARLDRLTGGRYSRACEQNQIGPPGQVCEL